MSTSGKPETVDRDGRSWRLGGAETVAWIARNCRVGLTITSAIPPCFDRYATITDMEDFGSAQELLASQRRLVEILRQHGSTEWWLGYLDTGAGDLVFPGAPKLSLYAGWRYVVVQAGPEQALRWRESLPDLMFPMDRAWCLSTLWDDSWSCLGGPSDLMQQLESNPLIKLRRVEVEADATPPGHVAF
jgi:hypothetical protein